MLFIFVESLNMIITHFYEPLSWLQAENGKTQMATKMSKKNQLSVYLL